MHEQGYQIVTPEAVLAAPSVQGTAPLFLDFDETLWLRNSTEEFLRWAAPGGLARRALWLVEKYGPWRIARKRWWRMHLRDWMRVGIVVLVRPGVLRAWARAAAAEIAPGHANAPLVALAGAPERRVVVISYGFRPVLRPLLAGLGLPGVTLVAAPLWTGAAWRLRGKRAQAEAALGAEMVAAAVMVTDSEDDADILAAVAAGYVVTWPAATYAPFSA